MEYSGIKDGVLTINGTVVAEVKDVNIRYLLGTAFLTSEEIDGIAEEDYKRHYL